MSQPPRYCFIATLGRTGQVITEALDALLEEKGIVPFRIEIITTDIGEEKANRENTASKMPKSERGLRDKIAELYEDRKSNPNVWNNVDLVPHNPWQFVDEHAGNVVFNYVEDPDDPKKYLKDIETAEHHKAFMELIDERTRLRGRSNEEMKNPDSGDAPRLIMLLAGGRKTMSSGAQEIMVFRGRPDDKLYHILVNPSWIEDLDKSESFWFRKTNGKAVRSKTGEMLKHEDKENLRLNLIELEYGIASVVFDYDELPISYDLALKAMKRFRESDRTELVIDLAARTLSYGGIKNEGEIEERIVKQIAPLPLAYFAALAEVSPKRVDLLTLGDADTASSDRHNFPSFREILLKKEKLIDPVRAEQRIQAKAALLHFLEYPNYDTFNTFHSAACENNEAEADGSGMRGRQEAHLKMFPRFPFSNSDIFDIMLTRRKKLGIDAESTYTLKIPENFTGIVEQHRNDMAFYLSRKKPTRKDCDVIDKRRYEALASEIRTSLLNIETFFSRDVLLKTYASEHAILTAARNDRNRVIAKLNSEIRGEDENFFVSSDIIVKGFSKKARSRKKLTSSEARDFSSDDGMYLLPNRTIVELSDDQDEN
ncbi:CRISPR-associated ring nuclease [Yoonia vestfoldensis]|uniref:CRISPR-associated ring nuclease n=1 Tax=Yoonia vestfoldensis TaxID=245188 RepID=UPI00037F49A4|nr:CRISPR-associated ring nuclease [Yoonia vestfoldensis]